MAETVEIKYRAFISYSHADTRWAKWLHRALEGFRIDKDLVGRETSTGPIPNALRPVFRDRDDFTAGHTLSDQTLTALDASHALIVICSPSAAKSEYVTEEVRLFKSRHPERAVIPLIVDGTPGDADNECFPKSLAFKLDSDGQITDEPLELLAADAREEGDGKTLALAKVVAGLLGVSSDDIFRRAEREHRRKGRVRNGIVAVLAFLAIAASGSAVYAWHQLKTNEAFLDATLERFTSLVDRSVSLAESYSVPAKVTLGILEEAEGMLDVMADYGRETPKMKYRRAVMLKAFADNYQVLGQTIAWQVRINEAQQLMAELVASDPSNVEWASEKGAVHERTGLLLQAKGDLAGALREYRAFHDIFSRLAEADPDNDDWQRNFSVAYNKVGDVLKAQGDLTAALTAYQDGLGIAERLAEADPNNARWQRDLSVSYNRVGVVMAAQGDLKAALKLYQESLGIVERLAEADPDNAGWQYDVGISHERIGSVLTAQGDFAGAFKAYEKKKAIISLLAGADPGNTEWQRDLAVSHYKMATILEQQGDGPKALNAYRKAEAILARLKEQSPQNAQHANDLSLIEGEIAKLEEAQAAKPATDQSDQAAR